MNGQWKVVQSDGVVKRFETLRELREWADNPIGPDLDAIITPDGRDGWHLVWPSHDDDPTTFFVE
jgi:hypothetical protein